MKDSIPKPLACTPGVSGEERKEASRKKYLGRHRKESAGPERGHLGGGSLLPLGNHESWVIRPEAWALGRKTRHSQRKTMLLLENLIWPKAKHTSERQQWDWVRINGPGSCTAILGMCFRSQALPWFHILSLLFRFQECRIFTKAFRSQSQTQPRSSHSQESSPAQEPSCSQLVRSHVTLRFSEGGTPHPSPFALRPSLDMASGLHPLICKKAYPKHGNRAKRRWPHLFMSC